MSDLIILAIGALFAAAVGAGISRGGGGGTPPIQPGVVALSRDDALRAFVVTIAREALDAFGSDKWFQVTQGRKGTGYSNCGDLVHAVLWWAGVREPHVNRQSDGRQWIAGNIAKLRQLFEARHGWTWSPAPSDLRPGDCYLIGDYSAGEAEHVGVVLSVDGSTITSADYGQAGQGGTTRTRRYALVGGKWRSDDNRRLVARGDLVRLPLSADPDPPAVLQTDRVNAAARALLVARAAA